MFGLSVSADQYYNAKNKSDNITIEERFYKKKAFLWDFHGRDCGRSYGWQSRLGLNVERKLKFLKRGLRREFWTFRTPMQQTQSTDFHLNFLLQNILNRVHDGGFRTYSGWRIRIWKWSEKRICSFSWNSRTVETLIQDKQIGNSPIESFCTYRFCSKRTLNEKMKRVVLVKWEFEYREKIRKKFPLEVSVYQNNDARE